MAQSEGRVVQHSFCGMYILSVYEKNNNMKNLFGCHYSHNSLVVARWSSVAVRCSLFVFRYSLFAVRCPLSAGRCSLFAVVVPCPLFDVRCSLESDPVCCTFTLFAVHRFTSIILMLHYTFILAFINLPMRNLFLCRRKHFRTRVFF